MNARQRPTLTEIGSPLKEPKDLKIRHNTLPRIAALGICFADLILGQIPKNELGLLHRATVVDAVEVSIVPTATLPAKGTVGEVTVCLGDSKRRTIRPVNSSRTVMLVPSATSIIPVAERGRKAKLLLPLQLLCWQAPGLWRRSTPPLPSCVAQPLAIDKSALNTLTPTTTGPEETTMLGGRSAASAPRQERLNAAKTVLMDGDSLCANPEADLLIKFSGIQFQQPDTGRSIKQIDNIDGVTIRQPPSACQKLDALAVSRIRLKPPGGAIRD